MSLTFEDVRAISLALPGVEEGSSYGTKAFRVRGKLLARLKEDGDSLVVRVSFDERELLMEADPDTFYITDHYRPWPTMLVRLSRIEPAELTRLLVQHWREIAPKTLVKAYDTGKF